jgi:hypothetical protein
VVDARRKFGLAFLVVGADDDSLESAVAMLKELQERAGTETIGLLDRLHGQ